MLSPFAARPWRHVPAVASISRLLRGTRKCATSLAVSLNEAQHASLLRACHASLVAIGLCTMKGHCTGEKPLSFGTRTWCDVAITAFKKQSAFEWHAQARHCARCLSGEGAARKLAVRAPCNAGCGRPMHYKRALHRREASLLWRADVVRRGNYGLQEAASFRVAWRVRHCARCLLGGGAARKLAARAPRRASCGRFIH